MRPADDIERLNNKAAVNTNPKMDEAVLNAVLAAHEKATGEVSAATRPSARSIIMISPIAKAIAAAAVVLIAVLGLSEFLGSGSKSGVAWAEVLAKTEQTPSVMFDMTAEIDQSQDKKLVMPSKNYVADDYGTRSDMFLDGKLSLIRYRLPAKKEAWQIRVDQKKYWRFDLSDEEAARGRDRDDPRTWLKMILSGDYTTLGRDTINGIVAEGIECKRPEMVGEDGIMRLWVDVQTDLPVRIEVEMLGMEGGQMKQQKFVMENFRWDFEFEPSLFEPNIPGDYTQGEDPRAGRSAQGSAGVKQTPPRTSPEQAR